jgi:hypothetical protein
VLRILQVNPAFGPVLPADRRPLSSASFDNEFNGCGMMLDLFYD